MVYAVFVDFVDHFYFTSFLNLHLNMSKFKNHKT
jgi:hypothetical protein